ncbi:MAG TPA: ATP-binding protein, partial [Thermomicrobiales bacterium]|nr:ATP-binding protein [Thermomicrobiales bacterium]
FREIFRRQCADFDVPFDQEGLVSLLREYYVKPKRELRSVHPRDILRLLSGIARYTGTPPRLTHDLIDRACHAYFVEF